MGRRKAYYAVEKELDRQFSASDKRNEVVTVSGLGDRHPVQVLSEMVLSWPPQDLRMDSDYSMSHEVKDTSCRFLLDVAKGMEIEVSRKDLSKNILHLDVDFHCNMSEFERYNLVVEDHNDEWEGLGEPKDIFDPVHGAILPVLDQWVAPAEPTSRYAKPIGTAFEDTHGPLSKARPKEKRSIYATLKYKVVVNESQFTLEYVAYDRDGLVLYYNKTTGKDLSKLVRQSVQELWGNPSIYGNTGPLLEGIPMLLQGKKVSICQTGNKRPSIFGSASCKTVNVRLVASKIDVASRKTVVAFLGKIVPSIIGFVAFSWCLWCLACVGYRDFYDADIKMYIGVDGNGSLPNKSFFGVISAQTTIGSMSDSHLGRTWFVGMAVSAVLVVFCVMLAHRINESAEVEKLQQNFM